jgi:hypothetical protein
MLPTQLRAPRSRVLAYVQDRLESFRRPQLDVDTVMGITAPTPIPG